MIKFINLKPFQEFLHTGKVGGVLLIFSVILSLIIANTNLQHGFIKLLEYQLGYAPLHLNFPIKLWINDSLMAIFFLLVGLEIKREILEGELSSIKKATLPLFAAIGGMLFPALIYFAINYNTNTVTGWGIPMATDIAFALATISMLGKKVPTSLKVFISALAIVDDLGAILVIAFFYTKTVNIHELFYASGIVIFLIILNFSGVKKLIFYIIPGIFLWYFIHHSGIHATIAGVLLALTIPTNPVKEQSALEQLEHGLIAPVNYIIMPVFALANTNIRFEYTMLSGLSTPIGLGIIAGLIIGKTAGISLFSYLAVKLGFSSLPSRSKWTHIIGVALLGGIGFTMSVFIALLSFKDIGFQTQAKFAILLASVLSGMVGYQYLNYIYKKAK